MYRTDIHSISVWYENAFRRDGESVRMFFDGDGVFDDMSLADVVAFVEGHYKHANSFIAYNRMGVPVWNMSMPEANHIIERMNLND